MRIRKHIARTAILSVGLLTACNKGSDNLLSALDPCISGRNSEAYPQSGNIECLHRLETGSLGFQASESTRAVQFANDSATLYTLSTYVQQWQVATGEEIATDTPVQHTDLDADDFLHYSPTRGYVGFSESRRVYTDVVASTPLLEVQGSGYPKVAYIDGMDMFAGYDSSALYFYDRTTGQLISDQPIEQGIDRVVGGQASYATAVSDFRVVIWPIDEAQPGLVLTGHEAKVVEMAYSDAETRLASVDAAGNLIVWDLSTGEPQLQLQIDMSPAVPAATVAFSPDNQLLVANGQGPEITFWSLASGDAIAQITIAKFGILDLDISPDGSKLAVGLSFGGKYDQNGRQQAQDATRVDPHLLEAGPAVIFDIAGVKP